MSTMGALILTYASTTIAEYFALEQISYLQLTEQIHGQITLACLGLLTLFSVSVIRNRFYEVFYKLHVFLYLMIVINVGLHKPTLEKGVVPIISAIGGIWCLDRVIRTSRMLYHSWDSSATLTALPEGSTKITFKRSVNCSPGSHAFVWIPAIRLFETHPFTISSIAKTEFVARKRKGFTSDLHTYALQHPNVQLRVGFDGPYGAVPNFRTFERVVLLAGGIGASFTFAIAMDFIRQTKQKHMRTKSVEFVWVVKERCE